jgi:DNA-binding CsgD family transcriptional regulator
VEQVAPRAEALGGPTALMLVWATSAAHALVGDPARARRLLAGVEPQVMAQPFAFSFMAPLLASQYVWLEEFEHARVVASALVDQAQQQGVVIGLGLALACLADIDLRCGNVASALAFASRSVDLAEEIGLLADLSHSLARLAHIEAVCGRAKECRRHSLRSSTIAKELEIVSVSVMSDAVLGLLELGLGRLEAAVQWLEPAGRRALSLGLEEPSVVPWAQDLAEAYVRLGARDQAEATLETLERLARRVGGRLPRAAVLRCRGLAGEDGEFEQHFTEALALHDERPAPFERARTELCFGERLRRARRRTEAREPLRRALETFERLGADPWADRALRELHATGERARRRVPQTTNELTPQELQVAVLMAEGATIKDAAAELFLSPKTIETHLYHAYAKLGVRSRVALARRLATPVKPGPRQSTPAGRP